MNLSDPLKLTSPGRPAVAGNDESWRKVEKTNRAMTQLAFRHLNHGWSAEPNAPNPIARPDGNDLLLDFFLNYQRFKIFREDEMGTLRFSAVSKIRLGPTNDEGWRMGQCRYNGIAPRWGEFYELTGPDPKADQATDWHVLGNAVSSGRHFLFYFRDETFEAMAANWEFERAPGNALMRLQAS